MARRTRSRSLGSNLQFHKDELKWAVAGIKSSKAAAKKAFAKGDCREALRMAADAVYAAGKIATETRHITEIHYSKNQTPQRYYDLSDLSYSATMMHKQIADSCLRKCKK